jgi:hypothetical protein
MNTGYPITERTNCGCRRHKVHIVNVRNQFNRLHVQLEVWLAAIGDFYLLRDASPLKWHNLVIDSLKPTKTLAVAKH